MSDADHAAVLRRYLAHADTVALLAASNGGLILDFLAAIERAIELLEREPSDPFDAEQAAIDRIVKQVRDERLKGAES